MIATVFAEAAAWADDARRLLGDSPPYARGAFLVAPDAIGLASDSAADNQYMSGNSRIDIDRAVRQHRRLLQALSEELPTKCFAGVEGQPDGVFPNNVFATARPMGKPTLVIGRMRHPHRRSEAGREDIRAWFTDVLGYQICDLQHSDGLSELTGTMVIDRSRQIGVAGLGPRCDVAGLQHTAKALGLRSFLATPLAPREYHANVVLAILGGRLVVVCDDGWEQSSALGSALRSLYGAKRVVQLDADERSAFAGNCIAVREGSVWMSERAADGLTSASRLQIETGGFRIRSVALDEIEKAGGSLRCCVAEIF